MQDDQQEGRTQVYELGYHIVPSVPEGDLPTEVSQLRTLVEENGGIIISDEFPKLKLLAYTLEKVVKGVKQKCDQSYFGWVKFEGNSSAIAAVKEGVEKNPHILRYLLIKTVKESTMYGLRIAQHAKMQGGVEGKGEKKDSVAEKPKMSAEEMDKTIDELVKE